MPLTTQQKLDEAEAAYHALLTGKSARVVVDGNNGTRVEYTAADKAKLYAYIIDLRSQLTPPTTPNNSPAGFIF